MNAQPELPSNMLANDWEQYGVTHWHVEEKTDLSASARPTTRERRLTTVEDFNAARAHYTPEQQALLSSEAAQLGVDPDTDPETFVRAHREFIAAQEADLQPFFEESRVNLLQAVAAMFGGRTLSDGREITAVIAERLRAERGVFIDDHLAPGAHLSRNLRAQGHWDPYKREAYLSLGTVLEAERRYSVASGSALMHGPIAHEQIHGVLATAMVQSSGKAASNVRNGLRQSKPKDVEEDGFIQSSDHGRWVNEALIEAVRRNATGVVQPAYVREFLILDTLESLHPGLVADLFVAAVDNVEPAAAYNRLNELLAPETVDSVEAYLAGLSNDVDARRLSEEILAVLPNNSDPAVKKAYLDAESLFLAELRFA